MITATRNFLARLFYHHWQVAFVFKDDQNNQECLIAELNTKGVVLSFKNRFASLPDFPELGDPRYVDYGQ